MNIRDFLTQDEIDDLPDDDPKTAFVQLLRIAKLTLDKSVKNKTWSDSEEIYYGFMSVVLAAGSRFKIKPFADMKMPSVGHFGYNTWRDFSAELDHHLSGFMLEQGSRAKRDSVFITPQLRETLSTYVAHLRKVIEEETEIGDTKRKALLKALANFEAEIQKKRLNFGAVGLLAITLLSAPGGVWASGEVSIKLLTNILRDVGNAKATDDELRQISVPAAPAEIENLDHDIKDAGQASP